MDGELRLTERFTNEEFTDLLLVFGETHRHCRAAAALYAQRYPDRDVPGSWVFPRLRDHRLKRAGRFDVLPGRKCCSTLVCMFFLWSNRCLFAFPISFQATHVTRPDRAVRIPEHNKLVRAQITDDFRTSVRAVGRNIAMLKSTVHEIIEKDLKFHPYVRSKAHEMVEGDPRSPTTSSPISPPVIIRCGLLPPLASLQFRHRISFC